MKDLNGLQSKLHGLFIFAVGIEVCEGITGKEAHEKERNKRKFNMKEFF